MNYSVADYEIQDATSGGPGGRTLSRNDHAMLGNYMLDDCKDVGG